MFREADRIKNIIVLMFPRIKCFYFMYSETASVPASSGTQVQPQVIPDPDYIPDYLFVSYDNGQMKLFP